MDSDKIAYEPPDPQRAASATPTLPVLEYEAHRHDPYAAMRFRDYRFYSIGWLCASIGFQMQSTTVAWELYQWTRSALVIGLAGAAQALPLLILALPAGHIADRYNRRTIAVLGQLTAAISAILLTILSLSFGRNMLGARSATILMFGLIFMGGVFSTFSRPARSAILPHIVPHSAFTNAVTWSSSIFEISSVAGPAMAGFMIAAFAPSAVYGVATVLALAFMVFLMLMNYRPKQEQKKVDDDLLAGLKFVWKQKPMIASLTLDLFAVLLGSVMYLLPIFQEILGVGPVGFGWLRAAPAIGAVLMALILAHRAPIRHCGRALLWSVAAFGMSLIVFGLSRSFVISMIALILSGAFDNISVVIRHTLIQVLTPDSKRGRVSAVNSVFIGSSNELGGFRAGIMAHYLGPIVSVVSGGIGTLVVVAAVALIWPQILALGRLQDLHPDDDR